MSDDTELTIEQLAQRTGMTVRNIRAHQSRGILPAPVVRGRTGFYGAEHVERLRVIRDMQADGFNLASIQRLLQQPGRAGEELLGFKRVVTAPFETEQAEIVGEAEIEALVGVPAMRDRAIELGIIRPLGDGRYEVPSPRLLRAGQEVVALGVPLEAALKLVEELGRPAASAARRFVRLYLEAVWEPFERAGMPEEQWPAIREGVERLRPLAAEALLAVFEPTMTQAVEDAFGREAEKLGKRAGRRRG